MPKQGQSTESKNIKNIYVRKINSLLSINGEGHELMKEKKIKKGHSLTQAPISRKDRNKESARKARLRKKVYIDLLEKTIVELEGKVEQGDKMEREGEDFLKELLQERTNPSLSTNSCIDRYLVSSSNNNDIDKQMEKIEKEVNDVFFHREMQVKDEQVEKIMVELENEGMKLRDCMEQLRKLKSTEAGDCKFEDEYTGVTAREKFVAGFQNHPELGLMPKYANERVSDVDGQFIHNFKIKTDNFLKLRVQD